jgi:ABC-type multidrug transport system fused ATPase/permease subunit
MGLAMPIAKVRQYQLLLVGCLILACLPWQWLMNDSLADMLKITLSVFALARSLNAVISVAQGTEMSIEPMGVGLTLAPGEILDPLNDLIEQFSDVLLLASASLGVQQIVLMLADKPLIRVVIAVLVLLSLLLVSTRKEWPIWQHGLLRLVVVLTVLRLLVPVMGLASHQLQGWLKQEREQAVQVLEATQQDVQEMNRQQDEESGWFNDLRRQLNIQNRFEQMTARAEQSIQAAIYLLAEFVLLMVILPLLFIWLMLRLATRLTLQ